MIDQTPNIPTNSKLNNTQNTLPHIDNIDLTAIHYNTPVTDEITLSCNTGGTTYGIIYTDISDPFTIDSLAHAYGLIHLANSNTYEFIKQPDNHIIVYKKNSQWLTITPVNINKNIWEIYKGDIPWGNIKCNYALNWDSIYLQQTSSDKKLPIFLSTAPDSILSRIFTAIFCLIRRKPIPINDPVLPYGDRDLPPAKTEIYFITSIIARTLIFRSFQSDNS